MATARSHTVDELAAMINRVPLFMRTLDETDGAGGPNMALEAIRSLAYEGTRAEVAGNFREQGNERARGRRWDVARGFYDKALEALRGPRQSGDAEVELVEIDEEEEDGKERAIEEACYVNRALCNLELRETIFACRALLNVDAENYRSCLNDCASVFKMNPLNVKAWYRAAKASLSLDRISEAEDACTRGLEVDPPNKPLLALRDQIKARKEKIAATEAERIARRLLERRKKEALQKAFEARNLPWKETGTSPDVQDATPTLEDGFDPKSTLSVPILLLYPLVSQTDLIKSAAEDTALNEHLEYILPPPWDAEGEARGSYVQSAVSCFVATPSGGLSKIARKIQIGKLLRSGKVELVDGLLRIYVVPEKLAPSWIEEYKLQKQNGS
jgi:hypothetical protein